MTSRSTLLAPHSPLAGRPQGLRRDPSQRVRYLLADPSIRVRQYPQKCRDTNPAVLIKIPDSVHCHRSETRIGRLQRVCQRWNCEFRLKPEMAKRIGSRSGQSKVPVPGQSDKYRNEIDPVRVSVTCIASQCINNRVSICLSLVQEKLHQRLVAGFAHPCPSIDRAARRIWLLEIPGQPAQLRDRSACLRSEKLQSSHCTISA